MQLLIHVGKRIPSSMLAVSTIFWGFSFHPRLDNFWKCKFCIAMHTCIHISSLALVFCLDKCHCFIYLFILWQIIIKRLIRRFHLTMKVLRNFNGVPETMKRASDMSSMAIPELFKMKPLEQSVVQLKNVHMMHTFAKIRSLWNNKLLT